MKKNLCTSFLLVFFLLKFSFSQAQESGTSSLEWHTSMDEASQLSKASGKPIFALFTGSDWCIWCKRLDANVFAKQEFIDWAKKNVILLFLDFPRRKQLPAEQTQQNQSMQQALKVTGYPTVWILFANKKDDSAGFNLNTIGTLGYPQGAEEGKEQFKFLENANSIMARIKKS